LDEYKPLTDPAVRAAVVRYFEENWPGYRSEHEDYTTSYGPPVVVHGRRRPDEGEALQWTSEHHPLPRPNVPPPFDPVAAEASLRYFGEARGGLVKFDPAAPAAVRFRFVTDPVVFDIPGDEPLRLGRFRIDFWVDRLRPKPYLPKVSHEAVALEPNPALHRPDVPHPHVNGKTICLGHAQAPFPAAFRAAQFDDAADYLAAVLRTYDESSPYVKLQDWRGHKCPNCDGRSHTIPRQCPECEEHVGDCCGSSCPNCSAAGHEGCLVNCDECDQPACHNCLSEDGDSRVCTRCRAECEGCGEYFHSSELEDDRCEDCRSPSCSNCGRSVDDEDELREGECIRCNGRRCIRCDDRHWSEDLNDDDVCEACEFEDCSECGDSVEYVDLEEGVCPACRTCSQCGRTRSDYSQLSDGVCVRCRTCGACETVVEDFDDLDAGGRCLTCAPECSDCDNQTVAADLVGGRCPACHQTHLEDEAADADAEAQV